ncbi:hypothetical protein CRG98_018674 [Punica granatum]|uniref:Uncharacterized protein n=1 Tax=Punica granatum TaxID=22663 RepID=A0A2I0JX74_PUNGR|nr:hypothetical protein CRG98_018674 [Punica granatum]
MWTLVGARIARFWIARLGSVHLLVGTRDGHAMHVQVCTDVERAGRHAGACGRARLCVRANGWARGHEAGRAGACGYGCTVHPRARSSPEMRKST